MRCFFCGGRPQYRDRHTGQYLCLEHARLDVVAAGNQSPGPSLTVRPATAADYDRVKELALHFWDETDVDCFGREYDVLTCPAFLACDGSDAVGMVSYAVEPGWDAVVLVMLNVLPACQDRAGGSALITALVDETARLGRVRILVATSNDDLLALAFYQRHGFHLTGLIPGIIAEHHGGELVGFAGIPVRDEIRLERPVSTS
jgi:ribosomal protein S18 acetylase RimI-like enzyme